MKKLHCVLALAAAVSGLAHAQSSLTVYGIVDVGVEREYGHLGPTVTRLDSGVQSGSRLGFKGSEDLGTGMKALFVLETGLQVTTGGFAQGGLPFARQSYVGLSGNFGTLTLGRQIQSQFVALDAVDPFSTGLAGNATNLFLYPLGNRNNNTVMYASPDINGFSGEVQYGFGGVAGNLVANRQVGGALGFLRGPIQVKLSYEKDTNQLNFNSTKYTQLVGGYDFGVAQLGLAYRKDKDDIGLDANNTLVGVTVPFGASTVMASYIRRKDRTSLGHDANQIGIGYTYALSKRTNLYSSYARINENVGTDFKVGNATGGGSNDRAFNVGIRHRF